MRRFRPLLDFTLPWAAATAVAAVLCLGHTPWSAWRPDGAYAHLASLGLEGEAAQVLLVGVEGSGIPTAETRALVESMPLGGVLLLGSNLTGDPRDAGRFADELQAAAARCPVDGGRGRPVPLIVAIDHEGGSVFRFKGPGITRIPAASEVGERGPKYAYLLGRAAGSELRALGITMALAPVVELVNDENRAFLGTRSYGASARQADPAAGAYIEGLQSERVAAVAKHFPGNAGEDPHKVLPELDLSKKVYRRDYAPRFTQAMKRRVSTIMLSHVVFKVLDPDNPASLSPAVIGKELRGRLGFQGLVLTDDVGMRALASTRGAGESAVEALAAGADLVMLLDMASVRAVRSAIVRAVKDGRLPEARLDEAAGRVLALKARFGMDEAFDPLAREKARSEFPTLVAEHARLIKDFR